MLNFKGQAVVDVGDQLPT